MLFDKKVQLQKAIEVQVDDLDFTGNHIGIESIYINHMQIAVGVQPHSVLNKFVDKLTYSSDKFTSDELTNVVTPFIDLIKTKIADVINNEEVSDEN